MTRIATIINRHLARELRIALTDDSISLIEAAELDGYKSRNLVSCLTERFQKTLPKINVEKKGISNELEMLKRSSDRRVWLLIDDLDATYQNTNKEALELSTFFSACRYIVQDIRDICIRVTMRTDVWPMVRRYDESLDKMEQYVREITWKDEDFRRLLSKRIKYQMDELNIPYSPPPAHVHIQDREMDLISRVFFPRMEWGEKEVYTYKVIYTLSYYRPRWAIQLCKLAQKDALKHLENRIGRNNINNVWGDYGNKRISDLISEHKHQSAEIEELINSFRGAPRLFARDELMKWINNHVMSHIKPTIEGEKVTGPMEVGHFMFRIGFLQARSQEGGGIYEHYNFSDMPDFLTGRTNEDFGVSWEIHPCYREALDIQKLNRAQRIKRGLIRGNRENI